MDETQEAILLNQDEKLSELNQTAEAQLSVLGDIKDNGEFSSDAIIKILDEIRNSEIELQISVNGDEVNKYTGPEGKQGPKGDKGESITGPKGKDGKDGKDGYTPKKGVDYFTPSDIADFLDEVKSLIRPGKDGKDGKDGLSPTIDYEYIIEELKKYIPKPKNGRDGSSDTADDILKKIKGKLSWRDLKDKPEFQRVLAGSVPPPQSSTGTGALTGEGSPTVTPEAIGQIYIDTTTENTYIAVSLTTWKLLASFN